MARPKPYTLFPQPSTLIPKCSHCPAKKKLYMNIWGFSKLLGCNFLGGVPIIEFGGLYWDSHLGILPFVRTTRIYSSCRVHLPRDRARFLKYLKPCSHLKNYHTAKDSGFWGG